MHPKLTESNKMKKIADCINNMPVLWPKVPTQPNGNCGVYCMLLAEACMTMEKVVVIQAKQMTARYTSDCVEGFGKKCFCWLGHQEAHSSAYQTKDECPRGQDEIEPR